MKKDISHMFFLAVHFDSYRVKSFLFFAELKIEKPKK